VTPEPSALLRESHHYLGHVDLDAEQAVFHTVPRDALRDHLHFAHRRFAPLRVELRALLAAFDASPPPARTPRFVFMTDWCGSTLLGRALEAAGKVTLYNEPYAFIALASDLRRRAGGPHALFARALELSKALFTRGFAGEHGGLVKEQPATNLIAQQLLQAKRPARAIFLFDSLTNYLASMLKDEFRRGYTRERVLSYRELDRTPLLDGQALAQLQLEDAEAGALHFLHQLALIARVLTSDAAPRLTLLRSRELFGDMRAALARAASALELELDQASLDQTLGSSVLAIHSKAKDRRFGVDARERELAAARAAHGAEIAQGLAWARRALQRMPELQQFAADIEA